MRAPGAIDSKGDAACGAIIVNPTGSGMMIGSLTLAAVQSVTNIAFGGADHKTLYITGLGNSKGLFQMTMNLPGRPY